MSSAEKEEGIRGPASADSGPFPSFVPTRKQKSRHRGKCGNVAPARRAALDALVRSEARGLFLDESLEEVCRQFDLSPQDRRLAMEITYGVTRFRGRLDHILGVYINQGLESVPPPVLPVLRCAAYQILHLTRVPPFAAVHDAVELARTMGCEGLTALVNAVLRALIRRDREVRFPSWEKDPVGHLVAVHSHPRHLVETWLDRWPAEQVHNLCRFNNETAPICGRINRLKVSNPDERDDREPFDLGSPPAECSVPGCLLLSLKGSPADWPAVSRGYVTIQDPAATVVSPLLSLEPGMRVWDVCAAPGGKCTHCAEIMDDTGCVIASDLSLRRLRAVDENRRRLGLTCLDLVVADGLHPPWRPREESFDAILLDVPCTGWGTFRRHPDLRWRLSPEDPERLGRRALDLLTSVSRHLRQGGVLVYATCTLSHEENEDVVDRFLAGHRDWCLEPVTRWLPHSCQTMVADEGWVFVFPPEARMDGLFAARLRKGT